MCPSVPVADINSPVPLCHSYGNTPDETIETCSGICPHGHFCESKGTVTPLPCPAGTYFPGAGSFNKSFCIECTPGQFQNLTGQTSCEPCLAGSYSAAPRSITCASCPAGGYCPNSEASSLALAFTPCPAGTFNSDMGQSLEEACKPCPTGSYNPRCAGCRPRTADLQGD